MAGLTILAPPRISPARFQRALVDARSPAAPENDGGALYRVPVSYGIDPAIALAFFKHESSYGLAGRARKTLNWGNLRRSQGRAWRVFDGFAWYSSWADGLHDFCALLTGPLYAGAGRTTVEAVIPIYAPSSDGNRPLAYIDAVRRAVADWEAASRADAADPWAAWGAAHPLPPEQRGFAIPERWRREGGLGAALSPEIHGGGRAVRLFEGGAIVWLGGDRTEVVR